MPTMKDVAKAAGVSIATVSATISGATYVSSELKVRVHTAIDDLGYAPNAMASGLKRGTSSLIGLIVPDITNPFFTESVDCVQRQARDAGLTVLLGCSAGDAEQERSLIRLMHSHRVAGTILFPAGNRNDCREIAVLAGKMPLVAVDCAFDDMGIDTVVLDNRKAALLATRHILSHGHQTVAAVTGPSHQFASLERYEGFVAAMTEADLPVSPESYLRWRVPGRCGIQRRVRASGAACPPHRHFCGKQSHADRCHAGSGGGRSFSAAGHLDRQYR